MNADASNEILFEIPFEGVLELVGKTLLPHGSSDIEEDYNFNTGDAGDPIFYPTPNEEFDDSNNLPDPSDWMQGFKIGDDDDPEKTRLIRWRIVAMKWYQGFIHEHKNRLCNDGQLKAYFKSNKHKDLTMCTAIIVDTVGTFLGAVPAAAFARMLVHYGYRSICED